MIGCQLAMFAGRVGHQTGHPFFYLLWDDSTVEPMVDADDGCLGTSPQAGVVFERHFAVVGVSLAINPKSIHAFGHYIGGSFDVAGWSPTDLYGVVRGWAKPEIGVESCDAPHVVDGDTIEGCDLLNRLWRKVSEIIVHGE